MFRRIWVIITINNNPTLYMKSKVKRSNLNVCPLTIWCAIKTGFITLLPMNEINILNGEFVIRQTMISNQIKKKRVTAGFQKSKRYRMCLVDKVNIFCLSLICFLFFLCNSDHYIFLHFPFLCCLSHCYPHGFPKYYWPVVAI